MHKSGQKKINKYTLANCLFCKINVYFVEHAVTAVIQSIVNLSWVTVCFPILKFNCVNSTSTTLTPWLNEFRGSPGLALKATLWWDVDSTLWQETTERDRHVSQPAANRMKLRPLKAPLQSQWFCRIQTSTVTQILNFFSFTAWTVMIWHF